MTLTIIFSSASVHRLFTQEVLMPYTYDHLSLTSRVRVAQELLLNILYELELPPLSPEVIEELNRRSETIDAGAEKTIPWEEVCSQLPAMNSSINNLATTASRDFLDYRRLPSVHQLDIAKALLDSVQQEMRITMDPDQQAAIQEIDAMLNASKIRPFSLDDVIGDARLRIDIDTIELTQDRSWSERQALYGHINKLSQPHIVGMTAEHAIFIVDTYRLSSERQLSNASTYTPPSVMPQTEGEPEVRTNAAVPPGYTNDDINSED